MHPHNLLPLISSLIWSSSPNRLGIAESMIYVSIQDLSSIIYDMITRTNQLPRNPLVLPHVGTGTHLRRSYFFSVSLNLFTPTDSVPNMEYLQLCRSDLQTCSLFCVKWARYLTVWSYLSPDFFYQLALVVYDILLSLRRELSFVWRRRFGIGTILYLLIRYTVTPHLFLQIVASSGVLGTAAVRIV